MISPGFPDGMRLDKEGNIYVGALDGVHVLNPQGKLIGKVLLPKQTANLTFGGKDNNVLFICSSDSIWAIKLNTQGAKPIQFCGHQFGNKAGMKRLFAAILVLAFVLPALR